MNGSLNHSFNRFVRKRNLFRNITAVCFSEMCSQKYLNEIIIIIKNTLWSNSKIAIPIFMAVVIS